LKLANSRVALGVLPVIWNPAKRLSSRCFRRSAVIGLSTRPYCSCLRVFNASMSSSARNTTPSSQALREAEGKLADLPDDLKPHAAQVFQPIESVFSDAQLPKFDDGRKPKTNPLNGNFEKKEFQELWTRINRKAVYRVELDSAELIRKCVSALDSQLRVTPLQYTVQVGVQNDGLTDGQLRSGDGFAVTRTTTEHGDSIHSLVKYGGAAGPAGHRRPSRIAAPLGSRWRYGFPGPGPGYSGGT